MDEPGGFVHVFAWNRRAVAVPAIPRPVAEKLRIGAWQCVMCRVLLDWVIRYDQDHGTDCPGLVEAPELEIWLG